MDTRVVVAKGGGTFLTAPPSGKQFSLTLGAQTVVVTEVGGGLRSYTVGGRELLDGYAAEEMCSGARGPDLPALAQPHRRRTLPLRRRRAPVAAHRARCPQRHPRAHPLVDVASRAREPPVPAATARPASPTGLSVRPEVRADLPAERRGAGGRDPRHQRR